MLILSCSSNFYFSNESLFLCLTEGKGLYIYICIYLYNNLSYARILIGSISCDLLEDRRIDYVIIKSF